jgi:threonyl-tRNA synthetase
VAEVHHAAAAALAEKLAPYRVEVDDSSDTLGKRIRNAEVEKIPFVIVFGDKESDDSLAIRERGGEQTTVSLADFRAKLATLDPWQAGAEPSLTS